MLATWTEAAARMTAGLPVAEAVESPLSPPLDTGEKFSMVFTTPGEIGYFCGFHAHMQGKIIVTP